MENKEEITVNEDIAEVLSNSQNAASMSIPHDVQRESLSLMLESSRVLAKKLQQEAADMTKLKEQLYTLGCRLSEMQKSRAVLANTFNTTKDVFDNLTQVHEAEWRDLDL